MKFSLSIVSQIKAAYQNWREPESMHALARLYWHLSLGISICATFGMIIYGYLNLMTINDDAETSKTPTAVSAPTIDKAKLSQLLSGFSARQAAFDALKTNPDSVTDPSK